MSNDKTEVKAALDETVQRFLNWKLPIDFDPDCGISFKPVYNLNSPYGMSRREPIGTNLLSADQAKAMLEHVCAPLLAAIESKPPISGATVPDLSRALQVAELRAKATPGRYGHDRNGHVAVIDFDQWGITVAMPPHGLRPPYSAQVLANMDFFAAAHDMADLIAEQAAEIERLRLGMRYETDVAEQADDARREQSAEIERLRSAAIAIRDDLLLRASYEQPGPRSVGAVEADK